MPEPKVIINCPKCNKLMRIPQNKHIRFDCPDCKTGLEYKDNRLRRRLVATLTSNEKLDFITHYITVKKYQRFYLIEHTWSTSFYADILAALPPGDHDAERRAFGKIIRAIYQPEISGIGFFESAADFYKKMSDLGLAVENHNNNFWFKTILIEKTPDNNKQQTEDFLYRKNAGFSKKFSNEELPYNSQHPTYTFIGGIFQNDFAHCSDNSCPCPNVVLMKGQGYIFIEQVNYGNQKIFKGNLVCEQGAKLRKLDLASAHKDALLWWESGKIPNRESLINHSEQPPPVRQSFSNAAMEAVNAERAAEKAELAFRLKYGTKKENLVVFVDIETSGLPYNANAPLSSFTNWPHIVQIAWQTYTSTGVFISKQSHLITAANYTISDDAFRVHGISKEKANREGILALHALQKFCNAIKDARYIVAHNLDFDLKIIKVEMMRNNIDHGLSAKKTFLYHDQFKGLLQHHEL